MIISRELRQTVKTDCIGIDGRWDTEEQLKPEVLNKIHLDYIRYGELGRLKNNPPPQENKWKTDCQSIYMPSFARLMQEFLDDGNWT